MASPRQAHGRSTDRSFERIYRRHVGDVYRYALAVLQHAADAEAVTRTTFSNAYHAFERGERPRSPQNWLIAIAHGLCRRRDRDDSFEADAGAPLPAASDVRRALARLAFAERTVLVMRELEDRTCAEIGAVLELDVAQVEELLFRARHSLREQLEGALRCHRAERAISRLADGHVTRRERAALRAHLGECGDCRRLVRGVYAQRVAFRALASVPVPASVSPGAGARLAQVSPRPGI